MLKTKPMSISVDDETVKNLEELKAITKLNSSQIIKHLIAKMAKDKILQSIIVKVHKREQEQHRIMSIRSTEKKVADPDAGEAVSCISQEEYNPYNRVIQAANNWDDRIPEIIEKANEEWERRGGFY